MKNLHINAIKVDQIDKSEGNKKEIYIGTIKVKDLINEAQFQIDRWDPAKKNSEEQGYQRVPTASHFRKIGKFAIERKAIFPGAILISCRESSSKVIFSEDEKGMGQLEMQHPPFWIIDGQHRVSGLRYAIEEEGDARWLDRDIPVIILAHFSKLDEVEQFKTLNTTSKKVSTDLAQQLMFYRATNDVEYRKSLKIDGDDWKIRCLKLIERLNETEGSPWQGRIKGPNPIKSPRQIVGQNSFLVSLKPLYIGGYFESTKNSDHEYEIIKNYWDALKEIYPHTFQTPEESVILKTPGIFSLHNLLKAILQRRSGSKELITKHSFVTLLRKVFIDVKDVKDRKDEYFWSSDNRIGASMYGSMKGFKFLTDDFVANLDEALEE